MKILSVTNMYPTERRPYHGIFVREFVEALEGLGVEVETCFTDTLQGRQAYFTKLPDLRRVVARRQYDVIHAHHTYSLYQVKLAQFWSQTKAPVVFTIHEGESTIPKDLRDDKSDWLKKLVYLKKPKKWALDQADFVVSVNEPIPRALGYQGDYDVIPPGVNLEMFQPMDRAECRQRLVIPLEEKVLLFPADPGNPFKGHRLLEESLSGLPFPVRVITGGAILHDEMPLYMNAADAVVQLSEFEASPMVIKEAMAVNVPMISTDAGDANSIFGPVRGYYICEKNTRSVADALGHALEFGSPTQGRGRILELGLSLEQVARRYCDIYERAVKSTGRAAR
ncbi:MAG: glycosyltransferase [Candidatus Latescibacterota bacterium]